MPSKYVEGVYPIFLEQGRGAYVVDSDGNCFIDYTGALGAILLGHAFYDINEAIKNRLDRGTLFVLPSNLERLLAEKLKQLIPCAEMSRFLKNGSDTTSAAVKIARSFTNREHIAFCGYHGWHDWYTVNTPKNKGIPKCYAALTHRFEFNNIDSLKEIFSKHSLAAVIMEPCIFDEPKPGFLQEIRKLCTKNNTLLIFDEVVTGFRFPKFSAQKYFGVIPDLATFGKAMANGVPMGVVCGKKKIMKELEGMCFVSSTFGGDLIGISAALETIRLLEDGKILDDIWYYGGYLKDGFNEIAQEYKLDCECRGYPNRTFFFFPTAEHKSLFWQECIQRGVFFGWANFPTASHGEREILYTVKVMREALKVCKENWGDPKKALKGKTSEETFRTIAEKKQ